MFRRSALLGGLLFLTALPGARAEDAPAAEPPAATEQPAQAEPPAGGGGAQPAAAAEQPATEQPAASPPAAEPPAAGVAPATPPPPPPPPPAPPNFQLLPPPWSGDVALGFVRTTGNTSTSALNGKLGLAYKGTRWGNDFSASAYSGSRDGQTTDERYGLADKLNRNFSPRDYAFVALSYDDDRFAGIAERYALSLGYGRHVLASTRQTLDLEAGLGANRSRNQDETRFVEHGIATLGGKYIWKISPTSQFSETLRSEYASNDIYVNPITELKLTVIGNLFAALDYEIRYNSKTPDGTRHVDQISTLNLGYSFGQK